ncbi:beta-propeller domain-containing protein [Trebonia kvetii]|uniref:beta-propeller domain-containing protein n=1 Tax=Trebonia kvetii TaxID=2480626 RepID=UPI001651FCDB|nr:beta-propeller domain-containing protein [Trebonia kvetii]
MTIAVAGCTAGNSLHPAPKGSSHGKAVIKASLAAFHSCSDALAGLRGAAEASVTAYGMPQVAGASSRAGVAYAASGVATAPEAAAAGAAGPVGGAASSSAAAPAYSGTNDYTAGVDEPDLVKSDGRRIVTVSGSTLEVIDAATRQVTGSLDLSSSGVQYGQPNLLLSGDHVLVISTSASEAGPAGPAVSQYGPKFVLVDLAGQPRVLASYTISGNLVGARLTGSIVRVVTDSAPNIVFPDVPSGTSDAERVATYRVAAGQAGLDAWLPRYQSTSASGSTSGSVPCTSVSRPAKFSGANLLTVLTFDMSGDAFGTGDPVTVAADGDTVYGTTTSLYVASGAMVTPWGAGGTYVRGSGSTAGTQIYRFDVSQPGPPRYVASGSVPGYLLNQYAMSEWNGYLRVATTTGTSWAIADGAPSGASGTSGTSGTSGMPPSSSAVYELTTSAPVMRIVGTVAGLGSMERIYAVRFMGPVGYVVTFRQTDPLYTLDLSDPARPRVVGALALTGYSAYLHPVSATRLLGVGQNADSVGHVLGAQVSLFDVSDLAKPSRLATYALASSVSAAGMDPHAFLYWPADRLVVVPIQEYGGFAAPAGATQQPTHVPQSGALVLRVSGASLTRAGFISPPQSSGYDGSPIERSLVIGQTLWTISPGGVLASDLTSLRQQAWLPFSQTVNSYPSPSGSAIAP